MKLLDISRTGQCETVKLCFYMIRTSFDQFLAILMSKIEILVTPTDVHILSTKSNLGT